MKPELTHLLQKLAADFPDFTNLSISRTGATMAIRQHGVERFESLDALEAYAWPQSIVAPTAVAQTAGSAVPQAAGLPDPITSGYLQTQTANPATP